MSWHDPISVSALNRYDSATRWNEYDAANKTDNLDPAMTGDEARTKAESGRSEAGSFVGHGEVRCEHLFALVDHGSVFAEDEHIIHLDNQEELHGVVDEEAWVVL